MAHRIKELLLSLPVDTAEAKRLFREKAGIDRDKFYRMYNNPDYRIALDDALRIASFFSIDTQELYCKTESVKDVVARIMQFSEPLKNLRNHGMETGLQPQRPAMDSRARKRNGRAA